MTDFSAFAGSSPTEGAGPGVSRPVTSGAHHLDAAGTVSALFSAKRLRLARELRSLTRAAVASDAALTSAAVSQFENGSARPAPQTLLRLAEALEFPVQFFATGSAPSSRDLPSDDSPGDHGYFRSLRSITITERRRALALAQLIRDIADRLSESVRLPPTDILRLPVPPDADPADPETCAAHVRAAWNISRGPIPDVLSTLERHGIVCARYHAGTHTVDAFSVAFPERPVAVLGDDKAKRDRERFSAAHELGHLVMHDSRNAGNKVVEDQANRFAAAFLMPADDIRSELPETAAWNELLILKRRWGASIGALLMRARRLGIMPESTCAQAFRYMSMRGWRTTEPGDLGAGEAPRLLTLAAATAARSGVTTSTLSATTGWPESIITEVLAASSDPRPQLNL
jgi:Zn-dependent peptidase ImmA (M78 family)/transcriptional regulator with XRE-family HTH domain